MAGNQVKTTASRRLERTKRWNLAGVIVTVGSSTLVYINFIAFLVLGYHRNWVLHNSPFGNPLGFGFYLDSILNALGMILLSGMFKDVPVGVPSFASRFASSVNGAKKQTSVQPVVVSFVPNSQASSTYVPTE
jgi:hypothetical protein